MSVNMPDPLPKESEKQFRPKRGKIRGGLAVTSQSLAILKKDKELLLFPILSALTSFFVLILVFLPASLVMDIMNLRGSLQEYSLPFYGLLFGMYVICYFIVIFFNAGLVACVYIRLTGQDPTFRDGIRVAFKRIGTIFIWSVISATVGLLLRVLMDIASERLGVVGQIISAVLLTIVGFVWGLMTYFVVPVIVVENVSAGNSIKRSKELFTKTWGENFTGNIAISIVFAMLIVVGFIPLVFISLSGSGPAVGVAFIVFMLYVLVLAIINASLQGIFRVALYAYAKTGTIVHGFDEDLIQGAFVPKSKKRGFFR